MSQLSGEQPSLTICRSNMANLFALLLQVLNTFRVLGQLYNLAVSGEVSIVPISSYAESLVGRAADESSDLLILPWSETGSMGEAQTITKVSSLSIVRQARCRVVVRRSPS